MGADEGAGWMAARRAVFCDYLLWLLQRTRDSRRATVSSELLQIKVQGKFKDQARDSSAFCAGVAVGFPFAISEEERCSIVLVRAVFFPGPFPTCVLSEVEI